MSWPRRWRRDPARNVTGRHDHPVGRTTSPRPGGPRGSGPSPAHPARGGPQRSSDPGRPATGPDVVTSWPPRSVGRPDAPGRRRAPGSAAASHPPNTRSAKPARTGRSVHSRRSPPPAVRSQPASARRPHRSGRVPVRSGRPVPDPRPAGRSPPTSRPAVLRLVAAAKLTKPGEDANAKRVAMSPPEGSHSTSTHRSVTGQRAASATLKVVTPGEPFRLQTAISVTDHLPAAAPRTTARWAPRRPGGRRSR